MKKALLLTNGTDTVSLTENYDEFLTSKRVLQSKFNRVKAILKGGDMAEKDPKKLRVGLKWTFAVKPMNKSIKDVPATVVDGSGKITSSLYGAEADKTFPLVQATKMDILDGEFSIQEEHYAKVFASERDQAMVGGLPNMLVEEKADLDEVVLDKQINLINKSLADAAGTKSTLNGALTLPTVGEGIRVEEWFESTTTGEQLYKKLAKKMAYIDKMGQYVEKERRFRNGTDSQDYVIRLETEAANLLDTYIIDKDQARYGNLENTAVSTIVLNRKVYAIEVADAMEMGSTLDANTPGGSGKAIIAQIYETTTDYSVLRGDQVGADEVEVVSAGERGKTSKDKFLNYSTKFYGVNAAFPENLFTITVK